MNMPAPGIIGRVDSTQGSEAPGRPGRRPAGGWIYDLAALGKAIVLCPFCENKFDAKSVGYAQKNVIPGHRLAQTSCDGCKAHALCTLFLPQEGQRSERWTSPKSSVAARRY